MLYIQEEEIMPQQKKIYATNSFEEQVVITDMGEI